jgi:hypothetical protein
VGRLLMSWRFGELLRHGDVGVRMTLWIDVCPWSIAMGLQTLDNLLFRRVWRGVYTTVVDVVGEIVKRKLDGRGKIHRCDL